MTPISRKYLIRGLILDAILLALLSLLAIASYQGRCARGAIIMPSYDQCSLFEYLTHDVMLYGVMFSPLILLALILFPLIGYHWGGKRNEERGR